MKIIVLMSTYNGEQYLEEQIQSIINQKFKDVDCRTELLVRDDGSQDGTVSILEKYQKKGLLNYYKGENIGFKKSFWALLRDAENDADYYAFSDQDDVWFEDKLARAIERLSCEEDIPLLYCSDVIPTDKELHPISEPIPGCKADGKIVLDFPHALIEAIKVQGCTCVFNREARAYMAKYDMEGDFVEFHDVLAGKIVSLFGSVIYDASPGMYYRLHGNNAFAKIHSNFSGIKYFVERVCIFFSNWKEKSRFAKIIEDVYWDEITDIANARCLYEVAHYRESAGITINFLKNKAFRTGDFRHDLKLFIKIMLRKI